MLKGIKINVHLLIQLLIHSCNESTVIACLLFRGCGIRHSGSESTVKGYSFLNNLHTTKAEKHVTGQQKYGNTKIQLGTRYCGN